MILFFDDFILVQNWTINFQFTIDLVCHL